MAAPPQASGALGTAVPAALLVIALATAAATDGRASEPWRLVNDGSGEPYIVTIASTHAIRLTCGMDFLLDVPEAQQALVDQLQQALGWPIKSAPATIDIDGRRWPAVAAVLAETKGLTIGIVADPDRINGPAENAGQGDATTLLQAFMHGRHLALVFHAAPASGSLPAFEADLIFAAGAFLDLTFACPATR
jgi:hypothetical protein